MSSFRFTKLKITIGYTLLLAILLSSLLYVHLEMDRLSKADDMQTLRTDSLVTLLYEKDRNTIQMLKVLSEANDSLLTAAEVQTLMVERDSVVTVQRVQHRIISKRDSLLTTPKKKGFFKRLAEAFVPSKQDSALLVNTSLEVATDTILQPSSAATDSIQEKIRKVSEERRLERRKNMRRTSYRYQKMNKELTSRMDQLIKNYNEELMQRAQEGEAKQQSLRMRSARIIAGIAFGAVLLAIVFLVIIGRDITRRNRYRLELEKANQRSADLLKAREQLMLAITHDFKAPLGSIIGYTDLLFQAAKDEQQRLCLENMRTSSEHLLKLVSDLLDFHRLDLNKAEVNRETFVPARLLEEIRVCFEPLVAAKGLQLQCEVAPDLSDRYISDPLRIRQVIDNLLSNALKFTPQGKISLSATYQSSRLTLRIADTGKGMKPEDRERIFQEFTRLPGAQGEEGFGLGLSIVKKLVALLEGSIEVESTLGEGSCFTVVLPLYPVGRAVGEKIPHEPMPVEQPAVAPVQPLRVLLIDDDKIQLTLTQQMLQRAGMTAVCCEQLEELIEQLRTATFDVLLTDIQMPMMNGFDLLKLLRASNIPLARTIPILAVTARSEMDEESLAIHGFAGCLHKPFTSQELVAALAGKVEASSAVSDAILSPSKEDESSLESKKINFSALTAFTEGDVEATRTILQTFIDETRQSAQEMEVALAHGDTARIAALAHKALPLFRLVEATSAVQFLDELEKGGKGEFSNEVEDLTREARQAMLEVAAQAADYLQAECG